MIRIKRSVDLAGLRPEMILAIATAEPLFKKRGVDLVVTSALDGRHRQRSLHHVGLAVDLRTRHIMAKQRGELAAELREALGAQYDVVLEATHLHIEFQPKR